MPRFIFTRLGLVSLLAALRCAAQEAGAEAAATELNDLADGGAAAYSANVLPDHALVPDALTRRFPVGQRARIHLLGGGVRGFGLLAEYGQAGPGEVVVARETRVSRREPYTPAALARVFDPHGNLVAVEDFTDQKDGVEHRVIKIPVRLAGVWRVSFSGGRGGDQVELRLPRTDTWGVRGEMSLGVGGTLPRPAYLWVPPTSVRLLVGIEAGGTEGVELRDAEGKTSLGTPEADLAKRPGRILLARPPQDAVVRLDTPPSFAGALVVEGAPGLFCPTEAAARRLRGGTVESHGVLTSGPLQARARDWMVATAAGLDRKPAFTFPREIPAGLASPQVHALMFGTAGFANTLGKIISLQNARLDPADPFFGTFRAEGWKADGPNWTQFIPPPSSAVFEPAALAAAASFESPLNPMYRDKDIVRRAALGAFANFASMQGDDLLREGSIERTRYPVIHAFFIYPPALAQSYHDLREQLDPEAREIWRQGLLAVGDKLADFQAYQSNQWSHMILGHLETYLATGEKRFLGYFERQAAAFFDNAFGPASKFGQHPAGFFLEQYGPDGNYDHLSSYNLVAAWYRYRELPEAKPALVEKIRAGIERNLRFSSLFWMPELSGRVVSPTAFNCRTTAQISSLAYPGMIMAKSEFPLGLARFNLTALPESRKRTANGYAFIANTDEWALDVIRDGLKRGTGGFDSVGGAWVTQILKTYSQPRRAEAVPAPVHDVGGTWTLPGLFAWNREGLYGVVFADVVGATSTLNGFLGGGPAALWSPATGPFLLSRSPGEPLTRIKGRQEREDAKGLTFSCVYGETADGAFFYSGKERAEVKTLADSRRYEVLAKLRMPSADLAWSYDLQPEALTIEVVFKAKPAAGRAWVNLPLRTSPETNLRLESDHAVAIEGRDGGVRLEWPGTAAGTLQPAVHKEIQRLVIPLPADGSPLRIRVTKTAAPGAGGR